MQLKPRQMPMEELPGTSTLLDQVLAVSARDRAQVKVVARQESRGILQITARDGKTYSAIVNEDPGSVDVADVRALFALMNSNQSAGGYLISVGPFTPQAYDWANTRRIRLVRVDEMDQLGF